jgi:hypothetical protein
VGSKGGGNWRSSIAEQRAKAAENELETEKVNHAALIKEKEKAEAELKDLKAKMETAERLQQPIERSIIKFFADMIPHPGH